MLDVKIYFLLYGFKTNYRSAYILAPKAPMIYGGQ